MNISAIIVVKDRGKERIENCINSIKLNKLVKEVILIDYGSKKPIKTELAKVIRYDKNEVFNKSHALNLGIKASKEEFIMTVDCDMILTKEIHKILNKHLDENCFIINTDVRRINISDIPNWDKSWDWYETGSNISKLNSKANGGMQVFSRKWIEKVNGYDEDLILFGAVDNDLVYRAQLSGLSIIDINSPIYHQEHLKRKEENLDKQDREKAEFIRKLKAQYIWEKVEKNMIKGKTPWGGDKPNQSKFMHIWENFDDDYTMYLQKQKEANMYLMQIAESKEFPISQIQVKWTDIEEWKKKR